MRRRHTGEGIEDDVNVSGFVLLGFGVVALALALIGAGYGAGVWAVVAAIACAVLLLAGTAVLAVEWRRRRSHSLSDPVERQGH
ncbi:hypothetical protein GPX89_14985 [Nocardia sp. ET3-3]|uniref:UsfY protein n=2 Tax=Nocardia terrae TaxID=2675851 RepID=A0A7K1UW61_9NOCA|nr:hypothetical protein [Nocardia terrae]